MSHQPPLEFDARPLVAAQRPPLAPILKAVSQLAPGQGLRLIAPFEPSPLLQLMAKRGYKCAPLLRKDGVWEVLFTPLPGLTA